MSDPDRLIRLNTVLDRTGLSRFTIYRKIAEGTFPAQLKISVHRSGWRGPTSTGGLMIQWGGGPTAKSRDGGEAFAVLPGCLAHQPSNLS